MTGTLALDLGVDLGGLDLDVGLGSDGLDVDLGVGGLDVGVGVGGSDGLGVDLDVDLDGDGIPETSPAGTRVDPLGQDDAIEAVKGNRALPLEEIMSRARLVANGEIIDAQLIQVRRMLLYEIKVLETSGTVRELYFYARSGLPVTPR